MNRWEEVVSDIFPVLACLSEDSSDHQRFSRRFWIAQAQNISEDSDTPVSALPAYRNRVDTRILPNSGQNLRDLAAATRQRSDSSSFDSLATKLDRARLRP
jgi:hypothetical protein